MNILTILIQFLESTSLSNLYFRIITIVNLIYFLVQINLMFASTNQNKIVKFKLDAFQVLDMCN